MRKYTFLRHFCIFFVSLLLHLLFFFSIFPIIRKKNLPVVISWLDILASYDLYKKGENINVDKKWYVKRYFFKEKCIKNALSFYLSDRLLPILLPEQEEKEIFISSKKVKYKDAFLFFLKKPSFVERKKISVDYCLKVDEENRIIFFSPTFLIKDDLLNSYVNDNLIHNFLFLKKENLFWTKIKVVVK
ncbi:MAG: hypothetical protein B6D56_06545 [Candidatus Omnitrophica bacterium 4484_70.1]|nr:MAG: hypothetical protein B6D56_06545 [Candidatus Omnitrophica bacterium 4484_70.1]